MRDMTQTNLAIPAMSVNQNIMVNSVKCRTEVEQHQNRAIPSISTHYYIINNPAESSFGTGLFAKL